MLAQRLALHWALSDLCCYNSCCIVSLSGTTVASLIDCMLTQLHADVMAGRTRICQLASCVLTGVVDCQCVVA
jgi:hypothetical protein